MKQFDKGETVEIYIEVTDSDGKPLEPSEGLKITITDPNGVVKVDGDMNPLGEGIYQYFYDVPSTGPDGTWAVRIVAQDETGEDAKYVIDEYGFLVGIEGTSLETMRQRIARKLGTVFVGVTSADGSDGGATLVDSHLAYFATDEIKNQFVLITSGTVDGEQQRISTNSGSTLTPRESFGSKVLADTSYEIHDIDPSIIKEEINVATRTAFPTLCRKYPDKSITTEADKHTYDLPSAFKDDAWNISICDADGLHPTPILKWFYSESEHTITFEDELPAGRTLILEGVGYLAEVEDDEDVVEVVKEIEYLYTLAMIGICQTLGFQEMGTGSSRYESDVKKLMALEPDQKVQFRMALPTRTLKQPSWHYAG